MAESDARAREIEASMSDDLAKQLEIETLDKLMAEERVEILQTEVAEQKQHIDSLTTEIQLLKAEMEGLTSTDMNGERIVS